jgi:hypothetical protein
MTTPQTIQHLIESIKSYAEGISGAMTPAETLQPWMITGEFKPNTGHAKLLAIAILEKVEMLNAAQNGAIVIYQEIDGFDPSFVIVP